MKENQQTRKMEENKKPVKPEAGVGFPSLRHVLGGERAHAVTPLRGGHLSHLLESLHTHKNERCLFSEPCICVKSKASLFVIRKKDMKIYGEKLRCYSSAATQMLSATLEVIKEKNTFGYTPISYFY